MDLEDDLFGDEEEEAGQKVRELDDEELDSGDDEKRSDRAPKSEDDENKPLIETETAFVEKTIARHQIPKPSDGELNSFRIPNFLSIDPKSYDPATFSIPTTDHHSNTKSDNFSAAETAATTIRYRKNPTSGKLESNAVLYRWSDGSTTIQVGDQHYEIDAKQLAPPNSERYRPEFDSNTYLASAEISSEVLQIVGHMSNQYTVRPNIDLEDDALERLQNSMAAATRGRNSGDGKGNMVETTQDPELQKKRAEMAEKERMKLQRRRETAAARATQQASRGPRAAAGGLSIGDLEGRPTTKRPVKSRPRRDRYDDSEEDRPRGRGNQDEYDRDDGFLASSEEEEEPAEGDDDEDEDLIDQDSENDAPQKKQGGKRVREHDSDVDADGEVDTDAPVAAAAEATVPRGKRRNVIEDDDDE